MPALNDGAAGAAPEVNAITRGIDDIELVPWLLSIAGAGAVRTLLQHPFLLLMTRKQAESSPDAARPAASASAPAASAPKSNWQMILSMRREHGVASLFRGFPVLIGAVVATDAAYFWIYEVMRAEHCRLTNLLVHGALAAPRAGSDAVHAGGEGQAARDAWAGMICDVVTTAMMAPCVYLSSWQMTAGVGLAAKRRYVRNPVAVAREIVAGGGVRALFTGLSAGMLLTPQSAVFWPLYGGAKAALYPLAAPALRDAEAWRDRRAAAAGSAFTLPAVRAATDCFFSSKDNMLINATSAMIASTVVVSVFNPITVCRTRLQMAAPGSGATFRGVWMDVWRQQGARGFGRGMSMNLVAGAFDFVAFAMIYEVSKQVSEKR
jgi:hypothetical protein